MLSTVDERGAAADGWCAGGRGRRALLLALGLGIALAWGLAVGLAHAGYAPIPVYDGAFAVAFVLYLAATALILRPRTHGRPGRGLLPLILLLALLPRAFLLASTPAVSLDVYRYIWEGRLVTHGLSPYRYTPDAPALAEFRDAQWAHVGYPRVPSPYPPGAQLVFAATYRLASNSVRAQQLRAVGADLLAIAALLLLLARLGLPRRRVLIYAWHPGPMLHFAHSAHLDALMIAALLGALALVADRPGARARAGSGALLASAALIKLVPLLAVPLFLRRWRWAGIVGAALVLVPGLAPYWLGGASTGLGAEAGATFNDSLYYLLAKLLSLVTGAPAPMATALLAALWAGSALVLASRGGTLAALTGATATLLGVVLLTNAVVMPWYLTWLLPFVALSLRPGSGRWPIAATPLAGWLWLSGAVQLTDLYLLDLGAERWFWFWPIKAAEYGPLFACLALAAVPTLRRVAARRPRWSGARGRALPADCINGIPPVQATSPCPIPPGERRGS